MRCPLVNPARLAIAALITALAIPLFAASPVRVLILTGESDYPYHDWRATTPFLEHILKSANRFEVRVTEDARGITAQTLAGYDVLVLNYNGPRWGRETEHAIEEFLKSGKGMVAVHGVSYGQFFGMLKGGNRWIPIPGGGWPAYPNIIGSTWQPANIGHAPRHDFPVKWVDRQHPISRGLEPTFRANDELYHRMTLRPNVHVLATAFDDPNLGGTGKDEPVVWTVPYGKGRVVHITLGHDTAAMYQPGFLVTFARSTEWAATGNVTLPARLDLYPEPKNPVRVLVVTGGHSYPTAFYSLFESDDDIVWSHAASLTEAFRPQMSDRWDVVVLHDLHNTIPEEQREALKAFLEAGKGVVALHHAIADYPDWPWWYEEVIGGEYFVQPSGPHPKSSYKEGVEIVARPVPAMANHPIIRGIGSLDVWDEAYHGMWHSPKIKVLMETDHTLNDRPVVYIGPYAKARVVYIQLGHSAYTFRHPGYRRMVHNAILWTAHRME